jgi:hypothetical protein
MIMNDIYDVDINTVSEKELLTLIEGALLKAQAAFLNRTQANLLFEQVHLLMANVSVRIFKLESPMPLVEDVFGEDYSEFRDTFNEHRENHHKVLYERLFIDNYQSFEVFLSDLFKALFYAFPRFLTPDVSNQEIGNIMYGDVFKADSILRLRAALIERKVKSVFQANNVAAAIVKLERTFNIDFKIPKNDVESLLEIAFDRNILVHNNGVVNDIYVSGLNKLRILPKYKIGEKVIVESKRVTESSKFLRHISSEMVEVIVDKIHQISKHYTNKYKGLI